jgi:hypothetical protein
MDRQYYAITTNDFPEIDEPALVARRWVDAHGEAHEEAYLSELDWSPYTVLRRIESGESAAEAHPITEEAGLAFEAIQHARVHAYDPVDGAYHYFKLVENGRTTATIRTWTSPQGYDMEETYTSANWQRSHVRSRLDRDSMGGDLVPITRDEAETPPR